MSVYNISGNNLRDIAHSIRGSRLSQAYDLLGNELFSTAYTLVINADASTGTSSGYSLTSSEHENTYVLRLMADFTQTSGYNYQSFVYNPDNDLYYKFDASTTVRVYDSSMALVNAITMPSNAGHNNDGAYYNGKIYFPNLDSTTIYVWDISANTVNTLQITGITQPGNGSTRNCDALCDTGSNTGKFYLICRDVYTSDVVHQDGDKLSIYEYDLQTGAATLKGEYAWDCVFIQGAACHDGILYVACNTQTTPASNYLGITVKVFRTDTWEMIDTLTVSGSFEAEGMDVVPSVSGWEIEMGMGKYQTMSQAVRFTPPYRLEAL